ncbi:MAG: FHA domain-containing protein, partial [Phycisphaerales bacterium]
MSASPDAPLLAELIARAGVPEPGLRWPLTAGRVTLGTVEVSGVPRLATEVVGCQAEITLRDGIWLVTDLGSATIRVDGEPLDGTAPLAPGSTIRCGEVEAVFLPHDTWAPTAP